MKTKDIISWGLIFTAGMIFGKMQFKCKIFNELTKNLTKGV